MKFLLNLKTKFKRFAFGRIMYAWYRYYKLIFLFFFCVVLGLSGWYWYGALNRYQWTEDQKKAYLDEYFKETSFQEQAFRDLSAQLKEKEQKHEMRSHLKRDAFTGNAL